MPQCHDKICDDCTCDRPPKDFYAIKELVGAEDDTDLNFFHLLNRIVQESKGFFENPADERKGEE